MTVDQTGKMQTLFVFIIARTETLAMTIGLVGTEGVSVNIIYDK